MRVGLAVETACATFETKQFPSGLASALALALALARRTSSRATIFGNRILTLRPQAAGMGSAEPDRDVGRRLETRVRIQLIAELVSLGGLQQVCVDNLSPCGASLVATDPVCAGGEVVLAWPSHGLSGTVTWADGRRCGITFSRAVSAAVIEEIIETNGGTYIDSLARSAKSGSFLGLGKI